MGKPNSITLASVENLDLTVRDLADQILVLREVLDEIREDLSWATRNHRGGLREIVYGSAAHNEGQRFESPTCSASPLPPPQARQRKTQNPIKSMVDTVGDAIDQMSRAAGGLAVLRDEIREATYDELHSDDIESATSDAEHRPLTAAISVGKFPATMWEEEPAHAAPVQKVQQQLFGEEFDVADEPSMDAVCESGQADQKRPTAGERFDEAINTLRESLAAGQSEQLMQFLNALSRFHQYSFRNVVLISMQRPDATSVAGFSSWKKRGRYVRKGELGIAIMAPISKRGSNQSEPSESESNDYDLADEDRGKQTVSVTGFRTVHVFDVTQTDGDPLPEFPAIQGQPGILLDRLRQSIEASGIELLEEFILGGALGESSASTITVRPGLSEAEQFRVLSHEFAHELLHKGERRSETTKTIRETEAEAVAFAVCHAVGLDMNTSSSDYIQLYDGTVETLLESLAHIRECTNKILNEILPESDSFPSNEDD